MQKQHLRPVGLLFAVALGVAAHVGAGGTTPKKPADQPALSANLGGNPVNVTDKNPPTDWSVLEGKQKNIKWMQEHGERGYGAPVVAGGRVFFATNNKQPRDKKIKGHRAILMCFDEKDGKFLWQAAHDMAPPQVDQQAREDGLCSVPTVDGDRVYFITPGCVVVCADVKDGKSLWTYDLMKELKVFPYIINSCSPLVVGDLVYVVTGNGIDQTEKVREPKAPSFVALEKKTGKLKWQSNLPGDKIIQGQWASPVYAEVGGKGQVIFPGGDGVLYSFEPVTGELIWKFRCTPDVDKPGISKKEQDNPNYLVASPVVAGNRLYIGLGHAPESGYKNNVGRLFCIDITKKGDVSPAGNNFDPKAAENKNSALVWHMGGLVAMPKKGGRQLEFGVTLSRCAVHDGLVYITEEAGYLHCLDAATGAKVWEHDLKNAVWSSPYWVDGKVYVIAENGTVLVFAHGRKNTLLAELDMDETVNGSPVMANGVLFIATKSKLFAIAAK